MNPIRNALVAAGGTALALSSLTAAAESFGRDNIYAARTAAEPAPTVPVDWAALQPLGRPGRQPLLEMTSEVGCGPSHAGLALRFGRT